MPARRADGTYTPGTPLLVRKGAMNVEIRMPQLSDSMTEADLIAWLVKPGDVVACGDVIAEIETDKSTVELEAETAGTVVELRVAEGTSGVAVGAVLAVLSPEEGAAATAADDGRSERAPEGPEPEPAGESPTEEPSPASGGAREAHDGAAVEPSSPAPAPTRSPTALARRIARQEGVDLGDVEGTGASGRITRADVERALGGAAEGEPAGSDEVAGAAVSGSDTPFELVPLTRMRRTIARRMSEAKQTVPHFYLSAECDVDALLSVRARLNDREEDAAVSVNDFIVRALALALVEVPDANVAWTDDGVRRFGRVDVSVAVATEGGLVTPVVRGAERKGLSAIAVEIRELAERARAGRLAPGDYQGGTFSVSNLGMYGIASVYPILNPPQAGILGVGAAEEKPVVRDGAVVPGRRMVLTLAADHRAMDGAIGARLLAAVKRRIEDPLSMLL
jgi:pyruvate dehydrogenase E2 component (dihydrolipoamide acetyltransferase)